MRPASTRWTTPSFKRTTFRKVMMTADCVGGVWSYAIDLVGALAAHDVEVTLFVSGDVLSTTQMIEAGRLENLTLVRSELKLEWMAESEEDTAEASALLRDLEMVVRPDVVHINGYAYAAAGFTAPVVLVAHGCVPTWWRACRGEAAPATAWASYRQGLAAGVAAADCVVAPTAAHLAAFTRENPRPRASRVIHNGRDGTLYERTVEKAPVALAACRFWDEAKNGATLAAAARTMAHEVRVAGEGFPISPNVARLGPMPQAALAREMASASVFVAPSRYEPFGISVLEAGLSGCALVLADIASLRELWDGAATFVNPDDPAALARAMDDLLADPDAARKAGAAARRRARTYSAAAMAEGYARLYGALVADRPRILLDPLRGLIA